MLPMKVSVLGTRGDVCSEASGYLLCLPGLESRALWMGHMNRDTHRTLIEDTNRMPLDWRDIYKEYSAVGCVRGDGA